MICWETQESVLTDLAFPRGVVDCNRAVVHADGEESRVSLGKVQAGHTAVGVDCALRVLGVADLFDEQNEENHFRYAFCAERTIRSTQNNLRAGRYLTSGGMVPEDGLYSRCFDATRATDP